MIRKLAGVELAFDWLNFSGIEVTGPPFGTDVDSATGNLVETDDYYSKIVVYKKSANGKELLEITEDNAEAREFIDIRNQLSERDREAMKKTFHKIIREKGHLCTRCHAEESKSFLPLRQLGFSERRIDAVTNLNIVGIVSKYKTFYMPNMFGGDKSLSKDTVNQAFDIQKSVNDKPSDDPRDWWKDDSINDDNATR